MPKGCYIVQGVWSARRYRVHAPKGVVEDGEELIFTASVLPYDIYING